MRRWWTVAGDGARFGGVNDDFEFEIRMKFGRLSLPPDFSAPPPRLAAPEAIAEAARTAPAMVRLRAFVDWVGNGRPLSGAGYLDRAAARDAAKALDVDTDEAQCLLEWAEVAGFVRFHGRRLFRSSLGKNLDADPLAAWQAAFESLLELGVVDLDGNGPPWGRTVDDTMADVVVATHLAAEPIPEREVVESLCDEEEELLELTGDASDQEGLRDAIAEDAGRMLTALADAGVIAIEDGAIRSTALGSWAAVQLMRADGFDVPVVVEE
jgi:hypothetical protein